MTPVAGPVPEGRAGGRSHPDPTFARAGWVSLDGPWEFCLGAAGDDPLRVAFDRTITVPFPPESSASGVGVDLAEEPRYRRSFTAARAPGRRTLLHFGAVDHVARVWVNGQLVGGHEGGYTPFVIDVTDALADTGTNELVVAASDPAHDLTFPRGKQTWWDAPREIWYRRSSGIWRSVWLEDVPATRLDGVRWVTAGAGARPALAGTVALAGVPPDGGGLTLTATFTRGGTVVGHVTARPTGPRVELLARLAHPTLAPQDLLWHPDHPHLVDIELTLSRGPEVLDRVGSYTGVRTVSAARGRIEINGRPTFQRLVLEQAYWPDTQFTAPSPDALTAEARLIRSLGFNGLRLHQVSADPRFLRACDELGLLVWADVPAAQRYTDAAVARTASALKELVERDRNHPSVVAWVPFNESWGVPDLRGDPGQRRAVERLQSLARRLDPTRLALGNDGWEHVVGDVLGVHDYRHGATRLRARYRRGVLSAMLAAGRRRHPRLVVGPSESGGLANPALRWLHVLRLLLAGTPVLLSEFGGVSLNRDADAWDGYGGVRSPEALVRRVAALTDAVGPASGLAGFCWTQLTDTRLAQTGLAWPDRTPTAPAALIAAAINRRGARRGWRGGGEIPGLRRPGRAPR